MRLLIVLQAYREADMVVSQRDLCPAKHGQHFHACGFCGSEAPELAAFNLQGDDDPTKTMSDSDFKGQDADEGAANKELEQDAAAQKGQNLDAVSGLCWTVILRPFETLGLP